MQCSKETLARLFYNVSSSFLLLLLFLYSSFILLAKLFHFIGSYPLIQRNQDGLDYTLFSGEEEEEEYDDKHYHVESTEKDHLVADIIHGGKSLVFLQRNQHLAEEFINPRKPVIDEDQDESFSSDQFNSVHGSHGSESEHDDVDVIEEEIPTRDADFVLDSNLNQGRPTSQINIEREKSGLVDNDETCDGICTT